jgi:hypothetical protein
MLINYLETGYGLAKFQIARASARMLLVVVASVSLPAQQNVGAIIGTVRDSSDAMVVGAQLVAQHVATGVQTKVLSNAVGAYAFPSLSVGIYSLTASSPGFKTVTRSDLRVVSGTKLAVDIGLSVGETTETISVTGEVPAVDTVSTTVGTTRTVEEIRNLPLQVAGAARSSLSFLKTLSAVTPATDPLNAVVQGAGDGTGWGGFASYSVDGVSASSTMYQQLRDEAPLLPEVIEEFRLVTNFDSNSGGNMGAGVELVTKSGTNSFHGSAFEYFRNDKLDAHNFFAAQASPQKQNEFGFVLGGPIFKNKTFFFVSYDGYRFRTTSAGITSTVPTEAMRNGDFSALLGASVGTDALGRPVRQREIYDPLTTRADGRGGFLRDPFAGNIIPSSRLSPISLAFQKGYPLPNRPGTQLNWVGSLTPAPVDSDKLTGKVDQQWASHRLSVALEDGFRKKYNTTTAAFGPEITAYQVWDVRQPRGRINYSWILRSNLLFGLRASATYTPTDFGTFTLPVGDYGAEAGLRGVYTPDTPQVTIQSAAGFGNPFYRVKRNHQANITDADLSWSKGKHNFKFGAQYVHAIVNVTRQRQGAGLWNFTDRVTGMPGLTNTGYGYATYLLGEVDNVSVIAPESTSSTSRNWGFYAHDQWRLTRKLTVNFGLRYEVSIAASERYQRFGAFDPNTSNPAAGGRPGALTFWGPGAGRNGRDVLTDSYYGAFGPRLGIAYAFDSKTVVRAYYGIVYSPVYTDGVAGANVPTYGWSATLTRSTLDNGVTPAFNWNNGFPEALPNLPRLDPTLLNGNSVVYVDPSNGIPGRSQNLGLSVERELPGATTLRIEYVGKLAHGLPRLAGFGAFGSLNGILINEINPSQLGLGNILLANINSAQAGAAGISAPYPGFSGSVAQALRPFPQYIDVEHMNHRSGYSLYHALEISAQKRLRQGFHFLVSYTFSKNLISGPIQHSSQNLLSKTIMSADRPQSLAISYGYELPFGNGKRFLSNPHPVLRQLVEGWQIAGLQNYYSGTPIRVTSRATLVGMGAAFPVRNPSVPVLTGVDCGSYDPNDPSRNRYLNIDAFADPAPFTFGNTSFLPSTRSCGIVDESLSVLKNFPLRENLRLRLGAEFFNLLNRHYWGAPSSDIGNPATFGRITSASAPRTVQLHLKVEF